MHKEFRLRITVIKSIQYIPGGKGSFFVENLQCDLSGTDLFYNFITICSS